MQYVRIYADELKAQGKVVEIFDLDYGTLTKQASDKWIRLKSDYAPNWIPDDIARKTELFIENETWIKNAVNEGYEIRNLGNPANDQNFSVFFDMEIKSVGW